MTLSSARSALVVAHPGHELRVHRWLEMHRPQTFVLTDGSGHGEKSRLESSRQVLMASGATPAPVFGRWSDRDAYGVILTHDLDAVRRVVLEIADGLVELDAEAVVSDAVEGFNPVHDLCYVIAESAALIAGRWRGSVIRHLDFPLEAAPDASATGDADQRLELDDEELRRKFDAARAYSELQSEVDRAFETHKAEAFRVELLRAAIPGRDLTAMATGDGKRPAYEIFGERRVGAGIYGEVLRFREHWLPLALSIRRWAAEA